MSKSRKVLGALLAVVMVLSVLSISAFAAGGTSYEEDASFTQSWSLGTPTPGSDGQYSITVILSTNYEVGPVSFKLEGVTSIVSVTPNVTTDNTGYYAALTDKSDSGLVLMIPDTNGTGNVEAKSCNNAVIATVTYTTNNANGAVTIAKDVKHAGNPNGSLVAARCTSGSVNKSDFVVGQTTTVSGELVYEVSGEPTPPPAETPVLTGVNGAVVDNTNNYVYGIPGKTADITTYLSASASGVIKVTANDAGVTNGTGATITLCDSTNKEIKSYTLVIFGDLDGDGEAALPDAGILSQYANYVTDADSLTGAYYFAGDLDGDGETALPDSGILSQYANYVTDSITVNPWAA